jgi:hypothetical protein
VGDLGVPYHHHCHPASTPRLSLAARYCLSCPPLTSLPLSTLLCLSAAIVGVQHGTSAGQHTTLISSNCQAQQGATWIGWHLIRCLCLSLLLGVLSRPVVLRQGLAEVCVFSPIDQFNVVLTNFSLLLRQDKLNTTSIHLTMIATVIFGNGCIKLKCGIYMVCVSNAFLLYFCSYCPIMHYPQTYDTS